MAVSVFLVRDGIFDEDFLKDRQQMAPGADFSKAKTIMPAKLMQLRSNLPRLEAQLSDGIPYLLGDEFTSKDAIEIACNATPKEPAQSASLPEGLVLGDSVVVLPEEPGSGIAAGKLGESQIHECSIRRHSEQAGDLVLHFPREDYLVIKTG